MRWIFKLIEKSERIYIYAYSRESDLLDGIISYDANNRKTTIAKPCSNDVGDEFLINWAIEHFQRVVNEGFPDERHVDCG